MKAILINDSDNVAVVTGEVNKGETVEFVRNNAKVELTAITNIPLYHKIATADVIKGNPVVKYGEHIGLAGTDIKCGEHVHTHNVVSNRENLT